MEAMRQRWSDDRVDDLSRQIDDRFRQVDQRFEQVDQRFEQVDQRFEQVDQRFEQIDQRLGRLEQRFDRRLGTVETDIRELSVQMHARFDSLQRSLLLGSMGMLAAFGAALIAAVAS